MVMKVTSTRPRRVGIAEAKARLSEVVADAQRGPVVIQNRGRDVAVVLGADAYEELAEPRVSVAGALLAEIERLKHRYGGGVDDFEPRRMRLRSKRVFAAGGR